METHGARCRKNIGINTPAVPATSKDLEPFSRPGLQHFDFEEVRAVKVHPQLGCWVFEN